MRSLTMLLAVTVACSGPTNTTPTTTTPTATTATPLTSAQPSTTTTVAAVTTTTKTSTPSLAISRVVFGEGGFVEVTNVGSEPAALAGMWVCQRPSYAPLPDIQLAPGEALWLAGSPSAITAEQAANVVRVSSARFGSLRPSGGEIGLYRNGSFGDSTSIVSYVEWGAPDHGRSAVAVRARIWPSGGFVEVGEGTGIVAGSAQPVSPDAWEVEGS